MNYQILATDMDGTLLRNDKTLSKENLTAIHQAISQGIELIICTGRSIAAVKPYLKQLDFPCWLVTNNGALIWNKEQKIVRKIYLKQDTLIQVLKILEESGVYYHGSDTAYTYVRSFWERINHYRLFIRKQGIPAFTSWQKSLNAILFTGGHRRANLLSYAQQGGSLVNLFIYEEDEHKLERVKQRLEQVEGVQLTSSGDHNLEVLDPGATKGMALKEIAQKLKISPAKIIAVGDHLNDLSMIQFAGLGIAMANGEEAVLAAADWVTKSNEANGVQYLIKEKILSAEKAL